MSEPRQGPTPGRQSLPRVIGACVLTVLAILLALVGIIAYDVAHTALDEAGFETISPSHSDAKGCTLSHVSRVSVQLTRRSAPHVLVEL